MRVGVFVLCYVDQFYSRVAVAMLRLVEDLGCRVEVSAGKTCCGQPMANAGYVATAQGCEVHFQNLFAGYKYVVSPSGSCVLHCREHDSGKVLSAGSTKTAGFTNSVSFRPTC